MLGQALSVHREKRIATEFPDLNPLDYHVMDALSEAVYRQQREKFATDETRRLSWLLGKSIDQWKPRPHAVVETDGARSHQSHF